MVVHTCSRIRIDQIYRYFLWLEIFTDEIYQQISCLTVFTVLFLYVLHFLTKKGLINLISKHF